MKKIGSFILGVLLALFLPMSVVYAEPGNTLTAAVPAYDASFNNNSGAFFANGTPVIISADGILTRISWAGGSIIVPSTVRVFGGGTTGSLFESSEIVMTGGTVSHIYGGGFSTDETQPANVNHATVKIMNGTVTASVFGGGLLYSEVDQTRVEIENGTIQAVLGGGAASATISGVSYNSGTQENPEQSGTRVNTASVILKGGTFSTVWGGGQGYSYTKDASLFIHGGTISYITAGGSNGLTETVDVKINGGITEVYQSVNRGLVKEIDLIVEGGEIETFYVGGETASDVTGIIEKADVTILGGSVTTLRAGTSDSMPLDITLSDYQVSFVNGTVINNEIMQGTDSFSYTLKFEKSCYRIPQLTPIDPKLVVSTTPTGFEDKIPQDLITFSSSDDSIVSVNSQGTVIGLKNGTAIVNATLYDHTASTTIEVRGIPINYVLQMIFAAILGIVLIALMVVFTILRKIFCLLFKCNH